MAHKKPKKPPGRCVFCNGLGLTKEHILSDWLDTILARELTHVQSDIHVAINAATRIANISPLLTHKQGAFHQRKVRNVCAVCNNGWMSGIVDRSKSFVHAMALDHPVRIDDVGLRVLAAWMALTTIMAEFLDHRTAVIPAADRTHLMKNLEPPAHWTIAAGRYAGRELAGASWTHRSGKVTGEDRGGRAVQYYMQATTMVTGSLMYQCISSNEPNIAAAARAPIPMAVIWPLPTSGISWPASPAIGDPGAKDLAENLFKAVAAMWQSLATG